MRWVKVSGHRRQDVSDNVIETNAVFNALSIGTYKGYGLTTKEIVKRTGLSTYKVRKILREHKREWGISWWADWCYGKNGGYTRRYKLRGACTC